MRTVCVVVISFVAVSALAASKPRLAIIPWVADGDSANYGYLSDSITDAIREELQKRFVFEEMAKRKILKFLAKNEIQQEDWTTTTAAFQIGTWEAQSVVISGKFRIKKRPGGRDIVEITANIFSIVEKKKVNQFAAETEITANMFKPLGKIAGSIADLAKEILPDPEQYRIAHAIELEKVTNMALIRGRLALTHFPTAASDLLATTQVSTADFGMVPGLSLEYRRYAILVPQLGFFVSADADFRRRDLSGRGTAVPSTLFVFSGYAGPTYYYSFLKSFYVSPTLGIGYSYISIDMKGIESSIYIQTLKLGTLTGEVRANTGYRFYENFVVELQPYARFFFYSGKVITDIGVGASVGYKF